MYAYVYGALTFAFFAIQIARTGMFYYWGACASNQMHAKKLHRVLNAPLGFFLAKPVGELLSVLQRPGQG
jgi:ABC-type bacteriocin/lantibiotic exporter with double-glycine peptidase domain